MYCIYSFFSPINSHSLWSSRYRDKLRLFISAKYWNLRAHLTDTLVVSLIVLNPVVKIKFKNFIMFSGHWLLHKYFCGLFSIGSDSPALRRPYPQRQHIPSWDIVLFSMKSIMWWVVFEVFINAPFSFSSVNLEPFTPHHKYSNSTPSYLTNCDRGGRGWGESCTKLDAISYRLYSCLFQALSYCSRTTF